MIAACSGWMAGERGATLGMGGGGLLAAGGRDLRGATMKMAASWRSAVAWSVWIGPKGEVDVGFCSACTKAAAAVVAASADGFLGMAKLWGKNLTVRAMRSLRVAGIYV